MDARKKKTGAIGRTCASPCGPRPPPSLWRVCVCPMRANWGGMGEAAGEREAPYRHASDHPDPPFSPTQRPTTRRPHPHRRRRRRGGGRPGRPPVRRPVGRRPGGRPAGGRRHGVPVGAGRRRSAPPRGRRRRRRRGGGHAAASSGRVAPPRQRGVATGGSGGRRCRCTGRACRRRVRRRPTPVPRFRRLHRLHHQLRQARALRYRAGSRRRGRPLRPALPRRVRGGRRWRSLGRGAGRVGGPHAGRVRRECALGRGRRRRRRRRRSAARRRRRRRARRAAPPARHV